MRRTLTLQSSALCIHTAAHFWDRLVTVLSCPPTLPLRAAISHARLFLTRMQTPWRLRWKPCSLGDKAEGHLWESHHSITEAGFGLLCSTECVSSSGLKFIHLLNHTTGARRPIPCLARSWLDDEREGCFPLTLKAEATGKPRTPLAKEGENLPFTVPHPSHRTGKIDNLFKAPRARYSFRILSKFTPNHHYPQIKVEMEIKAQLPTRGQTGVTL